MHGTLCSSIKWVASSTTSPCCWQLLAPCAHSHPTQGFRCTLRTYALHPRAPTDNWGVSGTIHDISFLRSCVPWYPKQGAALRAWIILWRSCSQACAALWTCNVAWHLPFLIPCAPLLVGTSHVMGAALFHGAMRVLPVRVGICSSGH